VPLSAGQAVFLKRDIFELHARGLFGHAAMLLSYVPSAKSGLIAS
jgi:hypothetical protein